MLTRTLGQSELSVPLIGLGCIGLSEFYGEPMQESDAIALLHQAVDLGVTHFDTAEIYGQGRNEQLLGKAFAGRWEQVVLATAAPGMIRGHHQVYRCTPTDGWEWDPPEDTPLDHELFAMMAAVPLHGG